MRVCGCRAVFQKPSPLGKATLPCGLPKAFPFGEGFERPENSPADCMDASLDALRALQRERAGRPRRPSEARSDEVFHRMASRLDRSSGAGQIARGASSICFADTFPRHFGRHEWRPYRGM